MMSLAQMASKNIVDFFIENTRGKTLAEISKATGITDGYLSKLRAGCYKSVGLEVAIDLALYFGKPIDAVLKIIDKESYFPKLKRLMAKEFRAEPTIQLNVPGGAFDGIRCLDSPVCLGPGFNMDEAETKGFLPIHKAELPVGYKSDPDRVLCFPTKGTSMVPTIMPDSHVIIDRFVPAEWVTPEGLYAFYLPSGDVTIKRLKKITDHQAIIDADNPDPKERIDGSTKDFPMALDLQEDYPVIRGRVIMVLNRLIEKPKT